MPDKKVVLLEMLAVATADPAIREAVRRSRKNDGKAVTVTVTVKALLEDLDLEVEINPKD